MTEQSKAYNLTGEITELQFYPSIGRSKARATFRLKFNQKLKSNPKYRGTKAVAWEANAEEINKYKNGDTIRVYGPIETKSFKAKDGTQASYQQIQVLKVNSDQDANHSAEPKQKEKSANPAPATKPTAVKTSSPAPQATTDDSGNEFSEFC